MKTDILSAKKILENTEKIKDINVFASLDSTNDYLKRQAKEGAGIRAVIADSQSGGKGRMARKFFSPENCGIYMSILIKPDIKAADSVILTAAAAVSVLEALEKFGVNNAKIKWVNDILKDGKKVCGILTEGGINLQSGLFDWAVVGIGLNVYRPDNGFEPEIENIAGYLFEERTENLRNRLCAEIINRFFYHLERLSAKEFLNVYKKASSVIGNRISVVKPDGLISAKAIGIDDLCRLEVLYENGKTEKLCSGEISIKIPEA